jgi:hypothetical protein
VYAAHSRVSWILPTCRRLITPTPHEDMHRPACTENQRPTTDVMQIASVSTSYGTHDYPGFSHYDGMNNAILPSTSCPNIALVIKADQPGISPRRQPPSSRTSSRKNSDESSNLSTVCPSRRLLRPKPLKTPSRTQASSPPRSQPVSPKPR